MKKQTYDTDTIIAECIDMPFIDTLYHGKNGYYLTTTAWGETVATIPYTEQESHLFILQNLGGHEEESLYGQ